MDMTQVNSFIQILPSNDQLQIYLISLVLVYVISSFVWFLEITILFNSYRDRGKEKTENVK